MGNDERYVVLQWFAWQAKHPREMDDPQVVWEAAWRLAAWHALRNNTDLGLGFAIQNLRRDVRELAETIERLERIAAAHRDAEIDAEIEAQSYYWHSDVQP